MIKRLVKQLVVFSTVACLGLGLAGCGSKSASASTLSKDKLIVGLDDTFAPMGFRDENGEITGFDVDLAKALGEKLGKTIEFQSIDWNMKETELSSGNIDFIWNGYSISDERKEYLKQILQFCSLHLYINLCQKQNRHLTQQEFSQVPFLYLRFSSSTE